MIGDQNEAVLPAIDNYSATAALILAAPVFLKMSKEGRLERDIRLLHLTGEEFPSDCMGARSFCRNVVQRTLKVKRTDGRREDLSQVEIKGVLVMDMIAHNRDHGRDIFQIAPGKHRHRNGCTVGRDKNERSATREQWRVRKNEYRVSNPE